MSPEKMALLSFDEITAERRRLFDRGRIELRINGKFGEMAPRNLLDATAKYDADLYNELAKMHARMSA